MANCITSARIVLSLAMFFTETFSGVFYAVYIAAHDRWKRSKKNRHRKQIRSKT